MRKFWLCLLLTAFCTPLSVEAAYEDNIPAGTLVLEIVPRQSELLAPDQLRALIPDEATSVTFGSWGAYKTLFPDFYSGSNAALDGDGSVRRFLKGTDVYFLSKGPIAAGQNCSQLFRNKSNLQEIRLENFSTPHAGTTMEEMFAGCSSLSSLDLRGLDTSNVGSMRRLFAGCSSLTTVDLSGFDTSKVTSMAGMFENCASLSGLEGYMSLDTSSVTDLSRMFAGCASLERITASSFDTSKVTSMAGMFDGCTSLWAIGVSFDTSNVTDMSHMFRGIAAANLSCYTFDTSKVTTMAGMFENCRNLNNLSFAQADTSAVKDFSRMFAGNTSMTSFKAGSSFRTTNAVDLSGFFDGCTSLTTVDLSRWNTSKVTNLARMFADCPALKTIGVQSGWTTAAVTNSGNMFLGDVSLVGEKGTKYASAFVDKTYARRDQTGLPGYFSQGTLFRTDLPVSGTLLSDVAVAGSLTPDEKGRLILKLDQDPSLLDFLVDGSAVPVSILDDGRVEICLPQTVSDGFVLEIRPKPVAEEAEPEEGSLPPSAVCRVSFVLPEEADFSVMLPDGSVVPAWKEAVLVEGESLTLWTGTDAVHVFVDGTAVPVSADGSWHIPLQGESVTVEIVRTGESGQTDLA